MTVTDSSVETQKSAEKFSNHTEVSLLWRERDTESGLNVSYMHVADISDQSSPEEKGLVQSHIAQLDQDLKNHPDWKPPVVENGILQIDSENRASLMLFEGACLRSWRESVPSARALSNLYWPEELRLASKPVDGEDLFNGELIDVATASFFMNGLDAIAIRTRAKLMKARALAAESKDENVDTRWISLASGAAIPVFEALRGQKGIKLDLVDIDPEALEFARRLAVNESLVEDQDFSVHKVNLISELVRTNRLVDKLGKEQADMVDMIGIFEYFRADAATLMLKNAFELVKPGGVLVLANMLSTRPQLDFNLRGVGWPHIQPRTLEEISQIIVNAGISLDDVEVFIPTDGVYAVVEIRKRQQS